MVLNVSLIVQVGLRFLKKMKSRPHLEKSIVDCIKNSILEQSNNTIHHYFLDETGFQDGIHDICQTMQGEHVSAESL